jgi:peptide/nickel transport system substrate-binding protein
MMRGTHHRRTNPRLVRRAGLGAAALACLVALVSAAAASPDSPRAGGTYRVAFEASFAFTDGLDPTGEYYGEAQGILANLMVRTLVGYDHVPGPAGIELVPDLATSVPKAAAGGTTYTFRLKRGIRFGPPVDRAVTSKDVLYAFERMAKPHNGAQYPFYYDVISGFRAYGAGKAKTIAGIATPDRRTVVFRLTRPTGDFLYRLAMPAAGPIPAEVAGCFDGQPGRYGRDLVSTGPYMIAGADDVDSSACSKLQPMKGFDVDSTLTLVRNPAYDPATDSRAARQNLPDEFRFTVNSNPNDILDQVEAGDLDDEVSTIPPQVLRRYTSDPAPGRRLERNPTDVVWFLSMNLTQPPFDDVHVRRAMNWIMDKAALAQASGGPTVGLVANHVAPDALFADELAEYAPYRTAGDRGSLERAKAAMKGSRYDTNGDGMCDAPACKHVLLLAGTTKSSEKAVPVIQQSAERIGVRFEVRSVANPFPAAGTPARNIALLQPVGWARDYPDGFSYFQPLFDGRTIIPSGNTNYSLVGITPARAAKLGVDGSVRGVPSVDALLDRCAALSGRPRRRCYESLDRTLTTKVVPFVPYQTLISAHVTGRDVTAWRFDQAYATTGYAHVSVG